jgi:hypothetical protein
MLLAVSSRLTLPDFADRAKKWHLSVLKINDHDRDEQRRFVPEGTDVPTADIGGYVATVQGRIVGSAR